MADVKSLIKKSSHYLHFGTEAEAREYLKENQEKLPKGCEPRILKIKKVVPLSGCDRDKVKL